jgi:hypothetical protein
MLTNSSKIDQSDTNSSFILSIMEAINWNDAEPGHLALPECATAAYISRFKMFLASGSFISYDDVLGSTVYGRIMSPDSHSHDGTLLKINVFVPCAELIRDFAPTVLQVRNPITQRTNGYLPIQASCCLGIPELVQTNSFQMIVVSAIRDILFVFRPETVQQGEEGRSLPIECQGMERAFLLRYREIERGLVEAIQPSLCKPFASKYPSFQNWLLECSPHRAWVAIDAVRSRVQKILCRKSEKQGTEFCRGRGTVPMPKDSWEFICHCLPTMQRHSFESIRVQAILRRGYVYQTFRCKKTNECMRFETCESLKLFKSLFSDTSIIGVRKPRPKIESPRACIAENDHCNVIPTYENTFELQVEGMTFSRRSNKFGLDMTFDGTDVTINVRYKRLNY